MSNISRRLERLEQAAPPAAGWRVPLVDRRDYASEEALTRHLAQIEQDARAAGWQPGRGVYVVIMGGEEAQHVSK